MGSCPLEAWCNCTANFFLDGEAPQHGRHPWETAAVELTAAVSMRAGHLRSLTTCVAHVLPVSDDGGSTAEIVRVIGGPAVGDIRSRCLRLADDSNAEVRTR